MVAHGCRHVKMIGMKRVARLQVVKPEIAAAIAYEALRNLRVRMAGMIFGEIDFGSIGRDR